MTLTLKLERNGHETVEFMVVHADDDPRLAMLMLTRLVKEEVRGEQQAEG